MPDDLTPTNRLLNLRYRKESFNKKATSVLLNWRHQDELKAWLDSCELSLDLFRTLSGYKILGMRIIDKGQ